MKKLIFETVVIDTEEKFDSFIDFITNPKHPLIAFDTETDDLYGNLVGMSFARANDRGFYLPFGHARGNNLDFSLLDRLKEVFESDKIRFVCHNVAYEIHILANYGIRLNKYHDTILMANLLDENLPKNLEVRAEMELGLEPLEHFKDVVGKAKSIKDVSIERAANYAVKDVIVTWMLFNKFKNEPEFQEFKEYYMNVEIPVARIMSEMGREGIEISPEKLLAIKEEYEAKRAELEFKIFYEASWNKEEEKYDAYQDEDGIWHGLVEFNLQSPKQKKAVFIEKLGYPVVHRTETKEPSFDSKIALPRYMRLGYVFAEYLLEWSKYTKVIQTYTQKLIDVMDENNRIHPSFRQTGARTGRCSSSDPNFQSMPRGGGIREAFVAKQGSSLICCDYDQLELRIAAHFSKDKNMVEAISNGTDLHTSNASFVFSILIGREITEEDILQNKKEASAKGEASMRDKVKQIAFSIQYGKREDLDAGITEEMVEAYLEKNSGLRDYMAAHDEFVFDHGFTRTLCGRKRRVPGVYSRISYKRKKAYRQALSGHIQGTAADIMKIAMVNIYNELNDKGLRAKFVAQVHDEVLLECDNQDLEPVKEIVGRCMRDAVVLSVPLNAEANHGRTWAEAK